MTSIDNFYLVRLFYVVILDSMVIMSFLLLDKYTKFSKLNYWIRQIIFGVSFGLLSIIGNELGFDTSQSILNCRNVAPILSGTFFGVPAGIISGLIGGLERYCSVFWGGSTYLQLPCALATIIAGLVSGILAKYVLKGKYSLFSLLLIATNIEIVHVLLVFFMHMEDAVKAYKALLPCMVPTIVFSCVGMLLSAIAVRTVGNQDIVTLEIKNISRTRKKNHFTTSSKLLLSLCMTVAIMVASFLFGSIQQAIVGFIYKAELKDSIEQIYSSVENYYSLAVSNTLDSVSVVLADHENPQNADDYFGTDDHNTFSNINSDIENISIVRDNIVIDSTKSDLVNLPIESDPELAKFINEKPNKDGFHFCSDIPDEDSSNHLLAGRTYLSTDSILVVEFNLNSLTKRIVESAFPEFNNKADDIKFIVFDPDWKVMNKGSLQGKKFLSEDITQNLMEREITVINIDGTKYYFSHLTVLYNLKICLCYDAENADLMSNIPILIIFMLLVFIFSVVILILYRVYNRNIFDSLQKFDSALCEIEKGNFIEVNIETNYEFATLSKRTNQMVNILQSWIHEAKMRIDKELKTGRIIQSSLLPQRFPPYPNRDDFELWATLVIAKEVSGDFYDFYLLNDDLLVFCVADVSDKGIPAALFMMTSKTLLKDITTALYMALKDSNENNEERNGLEYEVKEVFEMANMSLCRSNNAFMFVTSWLGVLDLNTGMLYYSNAGHLPPLVKLGNKEFEYLPSLEPSLALAASNESTYNTFKLQLQPGDIVVLYTDGLTEAMNENDVLYGEERPLKALNSIDSEHLNAKHICKTLNKGVKSFIKDAPVSDDTTIVCLKYMGKKDDMTKL